MPSEQAKSLIREIELARIEAFYLVNPWYWRLARVRPEDRALQFILEDLFKRYDWILDRRDFLAQCIQQVISQKNKP